MQAPAERPTGWPSPRPIGPRARIDRRRDPVYIGLRADMEAREAARRTALAAAPTVKPESDESARIRFELEAAELAAYLAVRTARVVPCPTAIVPEMEVESDES
jgi:hypothetical protein